MLDFSQKNEFKNEIEKEVSNIQENKSEFFPNKTLGDKEKIYAMPEKFIPKGTKKKSNKLILIIVVAFVVVSLVGASIFFLNEKLKEFDIDKKSDKGPKASQNANQPIDKENGAQNISAKQIIAEEFKNEKGEIKGKAELTIPAGALAEDLNIRISAYPKEIYQEDDPSVRILGAVYFLEPQMISLLKPVTLVLSYDEEEFLTFKKEAKDLKIGYLKENRWEFLDAQVNEQAKTVSISFDSFASNIYAIAYLLGEEKVILSNSELPSSLDSDKDGLTDEEEKFYKTDPLLLDTDGDGYSDGAEVAGLYSPISKGNKIDASGIVNLYTNPIFKYSLFYPANWIAQSLDETNTNIIFTSATGEFAEVLTLENPGRLNVLDWYKIYFSSSNSEIMDQDLEKIKNVTVAGQEAIEIADLDGQKVIYLAYQNKIYGLIYNYADKVELNFKSTFEMMKNSFKFNL